MCNFTVFTQEFDYKAAVTKHKSTCDEFEQKMHLACLRFEKVEDEHLQKMHMFVMRYLDLQEEIFKEMQTVSILVTLRCTSDCY